MEIPVLCIEVACCKLRRTIRKVSGERSVLLMIEMDGSRHSGSGTLLRYAVSLATLLRKPLHMIHIRAKRNKPGLRPQHLQALRACCSFCGGKVEGDAVGSQEIFYQPGESLEGGDFHWDIGTAGSTTMLAFTLLPVALFAKHSSRFSITGGLFQDFAPSAFHMQKILIPLIRRMGARVRLEMVRPGYVPKGQGHLKLEVEPLDSPLAPLRLTDQGTVKAIRGVSLSSHLDAGKVSERMADRCLELLEKEGYDPKIEILYDTTAVQKGAALMLWAETDTGALLGADQAGKVGRKSESIAHFVVTSLLEDLRSGATTDRHMADQLVLFAALAGGRTEYRIPAVTDHVEANLWLVREILGVNTEVQNNYLKVDGIGLRPSGVERL